MNYECDTWLGSADMHARDKFIAEQEEKWPEIVKEYEEAIKKLKEDTI